MIQSIKDLEDSQKFQPLLISWKKIKTKFKKMIMSLIVEVKVSYLNMRRLLENLGSLCRNSRELLILMLWG